MSATRQAATANRMVSPSQLDQRIRLVPPGHWIMIAGAALVIAAALVWGVFGAIPTRVIGKGVVVTASEDIDAIGTTATGVVREILVKVGDRAEAGQPILRLEQPELTSEADRARQRFDELQTHLDKIREEVTAERAQQRTRADAELTSLDLQIRQAASRSARLTSLLSAQETLLAQGLARRVDVEQMRQGRDQADAAILQAQFQQSQVRTAFLEYSNQLNLRVTDALRAANDQAAVYDAAKSRLATWQVVRAPSAGHVEEIRVPIGSVVRPGDVLVIVAHESSDHEVLAFLEPRNGKRVKPGMAVHVVPTTVRKEEFGSMRGTVIEVSERSMSETAVNAKVLDETLAKAMVKDGAPIFARIQLEERPASPSGFAWWSGRGPDFKIDTGTSADIDIVVRTQPPITTIVPFLNKAFGL